MTSTIVLNLASEVIGGKWRMGILYALQEGPLRFSELKECCPGCSVKVLSSVLKEMTGNNLLIRIQYQTIPVKVTYQLHPDAMMLVKDLHIFYKATCHYVVKNSTHLQLEPELVRRLKQECSGTN